MDAKLREIIADFVLSNRSGLSRFQRGVLMKAGAKSYLDKLGKAGIKQMDRESAGVLFDLACAFVRRLNPGTQMTSEEVLFEMDEAFRNEIHLPRSDSYHAIMASLNETTARRRSS
ncbi:MAG TPA: hypothetical protein VKX17_16325 [Planctomycetota bacterium]|nr:hypothetical protein [Planctomycetota bacterium]